MKSTNWFEDWFNSKYYHLLYENRDVIEAETFIDTLLLALAPEKKAKILDLACGRGRHAIYLNKKGFDVFGVDLSVANIEKAKQATNQNLKFQVHDMRQVFKENQFDYVFNLFTSFAYFDDKKDDLLTMQAISCNLKSDGLLVLDFMNVQKEIKTLKEKENKLAGTIDFKITRELKNDFLIKNISFRDGETNYFFSEKVRTLRLPDFKSLCEEAKLQITEVYGDYQLNAFDEESSERLIIFAKKAS